MDTSKLKVGMTIKNYKALCEVIGVKPTTGKAKKNQLEKLSKYVRYDNSHGNQFIIQEILLPPDYEIEVSSKSPYIKLIETLLVARLVNTDDSYVEYTYNQLIQELKMASENYKKAYRDTSYWHIYNNIAPISKDVFNDWKRYMYGKNKERIISALNSMVDRKLITYEEVQYVCVKNDDVCAFSDRRKSDSYDEEYEPHFIHREPTKEEWENYLKICRWNLELLGCDSIEEVKKKHKLKQYQEMVSEEIEEKLDWLYTYKKLRIHHILKNSTRLLDKTKQNLIDAAQKENIEISEKEINKLILNMINRIGENNHNNAVSRIEEWEKGSEDYGSFGNELPKELFAIKYRTKDDYLPGWYILSDYYIAGDIEAARDKARNFPVSELDKSSDDIHIID